MPDNGTQIGSPVDVTYAQAMLDLAVQANQLDPIADELEQIGQMWSVEPDLDRLLSSQVLSAGQRAGVIENLFKGRVTDVVYRFLMVVNQKGRLGHLPGIIRAFSKLLDERQGVIEVDAYVARRLDGPRATQAADRIGAALGRRVVLHQYVDPQLIGGLKLRVGDRLIDGSVATQLRLMKNQLITAGRDRARRAVADE
ncbi:MAG: ATP synthase F1 subunit delta [Phycisphaeraceae bacterium]